MSLSSIFHSFTAKALILQEPGFYMNSVVEELEAMTEVG